MNICLRVTDRMGEKRSSGRFTKIGLKIIWHLCCQLVAKQSTAIGHCFDLHLFKYRQNQIFLTIMMIIRSCSNLFYVIIVGGLKEIFTMEIN